MLTQADDNPFTTDPNLQAAIIPDCVVGESERRKNFTEFFQSLSDMEPHVAQLLANLSLSRTPATCVIADVFVKWVVPFAKTHALQSVSVCPMSATTFSIFDHLDLGLEGWKDYVVNGLPPLRPTDLPVNLTPPSPLGNEILECFANVRKADWIAVNSLYALDRKAVEIQRHKTPVHCVGPSQHALKSELNKHCSEWLDSKPARSVIYVSFGSFHPVARPQVREIAAGLMNSGCYFLWALRLDEEASHLSDMLPSGYLEECEGRGLIAGWFRQTEILKHSAVGGFLSHCGWNSVMESVSAGVPMLGFPLAADQFFNCRLVVEKLKFGLALKNAENENGVISGGEIEEKVNMLMKGKEGVRARRAAERVRDVAEEEANKGRHSATNLEALVKNKLKVK